MSAAESRELVLEGLLPTEAVGAYHHLPFTMPEGVSRLDVRYDYSAAIGSDPHLTGGNTLDIGLFDQRGVDPPGRGFRGWTGSARREFFITPTAATPGYLPGPLTPGRWHIHLGFYKSAPDGCRYRVTLRFHFGDGAGEPPADFPPLLTLDNAATRLAARADGWYRGELHCHTHHSDGDSSPPEVIASAAGLGLDFLSITDHNTVSHLAELAALGPQRLTIIPGCEVTTYKGHWNVWGLKEWIDFRTLTPGKMADAIRRANRLGYLTSCNHPRQYGPPWEFPAVGDHHCVEVWNGPWELFNQEALDFWEGRLRGGERLVAVGGSDAHRLKEAHIARIGTPTTWIHCPGQPTAAALLAGLRAGHVFISEAPDGPQLYLRAGEAMMGDVVPRPPGGRLSVEVRVVGGAGTLLELRGADGCLQRLPIQHDEQTVAADLSVAATPYVRAQLVESDSGSPPVRALTNPLYLGQKSEQP